jgi:peptidoglycan/LPS O-acetylase OafA/YrhL
LSLRKHVVRARLPKVVASEAGAKREHGRPHVLALDGLRGLAIGLVILIHFTLYLGMTEKTLVDRLVNRVFLTGWCGVDLFFTLSGFLITGILLDTKGFDRPLYNFYGRRFLRIFPPYYLFLTIYLVVIAHLLPPPLFAPELPYQAWYWTYFANVRVAIQGWRDPVLVHFWSLAVEEQFYLVWPFVVLATDRTTLGRLCVGMLAIALGLRVTCWALKMPEAAYALTPCRMDSLAAGACVAVLQRSAVAPETMLYWAKRIGGAAAACLGIIIVVRRGLTHFDPVVYTLGITLVALASASLVVGAVFAGERAGIQRALRTGWLRAMGRYSYGMYIIHVPVLCLMLLVRADLRNVKPIGGNLAPWLLLQTTVGGIVIFLIALASWHLYEKRLIGLKRYFEDRPRAAAAVAASSATE